MGRVTDSLLEASVRVLDRTIVLRAVELAHYHNGPPTFDHM